MGNSSILIYIFHVGCAMKLFIYQVTSNFLLLFLYLWIYVYILNLDFICNTSQAFVPNSYTSCNSNSTFYLSLIFFTLYLQIFDCSYYFPRSFGCTILHLLGTIFLFLMYYILNVLYIFFFEIRNIINPKKLVQLLS